MYLKELVRVISSTPHLKQSAVFICHCSHLLFNVLYVCFYGHGWKSSFQLNGVGIIIDRHCCLAMQFGIA